MLLCLPESLTGVLFCLSKALRFGAGEEVALLLPQARGNREPGPAELCF